MLLSDTIDRKFVERLDVDEWQVETDSGWVDVVQTNLTEEYEIYEVELEDGRVLKCADDHIFFTEHLEEVFAKDSLDKRLTTKDGPFRVVRVTPTGKWDNMYDLSVASTSQRYYGDGVLSHNTAGVSVALTHEIIFNSGKRTAVVAHKAGQAGEILARIRTILENLPFFLQPEVKLYSQGRVVFANDSWIQAFSSTSSSLRGKSLTHLYLDEFAFVDRDDEFMTGTYPVISSGKKTKITITSTANGVGNSFHKLYTESLEGLNSYGNMRVDWWDVPGRDAAWKAETISNTSQKQFDQEFCLGGQSKVRVKINDCELELELRDLYELLERTAPGLSADAG